MDRAWLNDQLSQGRSLEAIAREIGRHPSTVAYWARKHGLTSSHAERHAPRGAIPYDDLAMVVQIDLPIRDMADVFQRSPTTIRHWMHKHGLETARMRRERLGRAAIAAGLDVADLPCPRHGLTRHVRRRGGFRCAQCRVDHVSDKRRRLKRQLVMEAGGRCRLCGYDRCLAALQFHHIDPAAKQFAMSARGLARSLAAARAEADKCVLLCANCHAEVESGIAQVPLRSGDDSDYRCLAQAADPG